jgi:hypothetical protein
LRRLAKLILDPQSAGHAICGHVLPTLNISDPIWLPLSSSTLAARNGASCMAKSGALLACYFIYHLPPAAAVAANNVILTLTQHAEEGRYLCLAAD